MLCACSLITASVASLILGENSLHRYWKIKNVCILTFCDHQLLFGAQCMWKYLRALFVRYFFQISYFFRSYHCGSNFSVKVFKHQSRQCSNTYRSQSGGHYFTCSSVLDCISSVWINWLLVDFSYRHGFLYTFYSILVLGDEEQQIHSKRSVYWMDPCHHCYGYQHVSFKIFLNYIEY